MRIDKGLVEQVIRKEKIRNTLRKELQDLQVAINGCLIKKPKVKRLLWKHTYYCPYCNRKLTQKYKGWPIIRCPKCSYELIDSRLGR